MEVIETWKKKWGIPNLVSLIDGKDGLLINFNNELSVRVFLDEIQEQKSIELREFLFDGKNSLIKDKAGKAYANEIIAFLFNPAHKLPHTPLSAKHTAYKSNQRYYSLGSEWLYYKIYCGVKTADTLLANEILQLVKYLSSKGLLERWFFIRYADPETHIRLRIFNKDRDKIFEIIKIVHEYISPLQKNGIISKILSDTYIREFERYGWHSMEISEEYFDIDSRAALSLLEFSVKNGNDEIKWHYFAGSVNDLLTSFNYSLEEKINLTGHLKTCYLNEHGGSKELKLQLDEKYRALKPMIENVLNKIGETPISPVIKLLDFKREQTSQIVAELIGLKQKNLLTVPTNDMISSYLHMSANRIFMAKQRTYEMVIYDMLYRFYKSQLAKNKFALNGAKTTN
jgi:thiopeptide-type bacteriocin biosynthesis protein